MAVFSELPVYKGSYDLIILLFEEIGNFRKDFKYTLGERLKEEAIALVINIYRANSRVDKVGLLEAARENIEVVRLLVRLCSDLKVLSLKKFIQINDKIENISKQLAGWFISEKKKSSATDGQRSAG